MVLSLSHLAQKPGGPLFNSLAGNAGDWNNFYLFVYPFYCPGKGLNIKLPTFSIMNRGDIARVIYGEVTLDGNHFGNLRYLLLECSLNTLFQGYR